MGTVTGFLAAAGVAFAVAAGAGGAGAAARPPIDGRRPPRTERAVFALG